MLDYDENKRENKFLIEYLSSSWDDLYNLLSWQERESAWKKLSELRYHIEYEEPLNAEFAVNDLLSDLLKSKGAMETGTILIASIVRANLPYYPEKLPFIKINPYHVITQSLLKYPDILLAQIDQKDSNVDVDRFRERLTYVRQHVSPVNQVETMTIANELLSDFLKTDAASLVRITLRDSMYKVSANLLSDYDNRSALNPVINIQDPKESYEWGVSEDKFTTSYHKAHDLKRSGTSSSIPPEEFVGGEDQLQDTDAGKTINAWIPEITDTSSSTLDVGHVYTLYFKVGDPVSNSFFKGENDKIDAAEIPESGLYTDWVVSYFNAKVNISPDNIITVSTNRDTAIAKFKLLIPKMGDSITLGMGITPREAGEIQLSVLIYAAGDDSPRKELYRQFEIKLTATTGISEPSSTGEKKESPNLVLNDLVRAPASQLNLRTTHEWTTPPGDLSIAVLPNDAYVRGNAGSKEVNGMMTWYGVPAVVAGLIQNVLNSAEAFRAANDSYLNNIDAADVHNVINDFAPNYDWTNFHYTTDAAHETSWNTVAASPELAALAYDGYVLYETFFPTGSDLRVVMDALIPGQRINISLLPSSGSNYLPHVPWNLFYTKPVDGTPICGEAFMGLRYRIDYTSHAVSAASRSLGGVGNAYSANLLYWGNQPQDPVFAEVNWQQQELSQWPQQVNIPQPTTNNAKIDLLNMLNKPAPSPMAVLYFYCHCSVGKGNTPVLRFGSTNDSTDVVGRIEIGTLAMADKPLIFANACSTATADAYMANELAEIFFRRGCRAFLGTETKVPVLFASRFAFLFFNFFYRKIDAAPMAGGEAVVQARLWCWTHYRNIGGLFYSYINQYELFMAEEAEVKALRR